MDLNGILYVKKQSLQAFNNYQIFITACTALVCGKDLYLIDLTVYSTKKIYAANFAQDPPPNIEIPIQFKNQNKFIYQLPALSEKTKSIQLQTF